MLSTKADTTALVAEHATGATGVTAGVTAGVTSLPATKTLRIFLSSPNKKIIMYNINPLNIEGGKLGKVGV